MVLFRKRIKQAVDIQRTVFLRSFSLTQVPLKVVTRSEFLVRLKKKPLPLYGLSFSSMSRNSANVTDTL